MKIKRYEIISDSPLPDRFRIVDKLKDDFVCIPLVDSEEALIEIMGKDMNELVDSSLVHPGYLKEEHEEEECE